MSSDQFTAFVASREAAHDAVMRAYDAAKMFLASGKTVVIAVKEADDDISIKLRGFLHGAVLPQISEQVRLPDGTRYTVEAWKIYYVQKLLPQRWKLMRLPGSKKATPRKVRVSTEELGNQHYSKFIDEIIADAITEWSVDFRFRTEEREAVRYKPPRKTQKSNT